jgi:putative colanic acid biosynthesis acetyltransferase WcaF
MNYFVQDLSRFRVPREFRGRSVIGVQFWWLFQTTVFHWSPQFAYGFRRWILRCFGAKIGKGVIVRPSAVITYPWKVVIGDYAWIGDDVVLYSLGEIEIGAHSVISQSSYLCAGDHDYTQAHFPIRASKVTIGPQAWVAADVFVAPGVSIGQGTVIGARSSVFGDMPPGMVCFGYPCKPVKARRGACEDGQPSKEKYR